MAARGKHGASTLPTSPARRAFLAARAQSAPAIGAAREALCARMREAAAESPADVPGAFSLLYESQDSRLCLFQTADGHLCAIDSAKLA